MQVCSLKTDAGGAPVDFTLEPLTDEAVAAGWQLDSLKTAANAGECKPVTIMYTQPRVPRAASAAAFDCAEFVSVLLDGVGKGGLPAVPSTEGRRYRIKVQVWVNPVAVPEAERTAAAPSKGGKGAK